MKRLAYSIILCAGLASLAFAIPSSFGKDDAYHQAIKMAAAGQQFALKKQWRNACSTYEQTLQIYPNYPAVKTELAQAYVELANQMSARKGFAYFKRAAELDPNNAAAKAGLSKEKPNQKDLPAAGETRAFSATSANARTAQEQATDLSDLPDEDRIPVRKDGTRLMVNTKLNGRDLEFQFDTGANFCLVGANHLKAIGIDTAKLKGEAALVGGAGGGAVATLVVPMTLQIGKTKRTVSMYVHPNFPGNPLIGQNFLTGLQYEINNQLSVIILRKEKESSELASSTKKVDPRDRNVVPYTMAGKSIVVPVEVCGKKVEMIFDTGADGILFGAAAWQDLHLTSARLLGVGSARGIDGVRPVLGYNVERIDFGPVNLRDITVMVSNPGPSRPLLGQKVLGAEKFIIDDKRKLIIFHR